jgi:hypothetical protein
MSPRSTNVTIIYLLLKSLLCYQWFQTFYAKLGKVWRSWDRASRYISIAKSTRCTIFRVYWISLYMFRTVFPSIIRSSRLYIEYQMENLVPASMKSTNLYDIYLIRYVHSLTPDDGRKDRPKHVEWYSINSKNSTSCWFYYRNIM